MLLIGFLRRNRVRMGRRPTPCCQYRYSIQPSMPSGIDEVSVALIVHVPDAFSPEKTERLSAGGVGSGSGIALQEQHKNNARTFHPSRAAVDNCRAQSRAEVRLIVHPFTAVPFVSVKRSPAPLQIRISAQLISSLSRASVNAVERSSSHRL